MKTAAVRTCALFVVVGLLALAQGSGLADDAAQAQAAPEESPQPSERLPDDVRAVLREEMGAQLDAMIELTPALVMGDIAGVAELARGMADSFIDERLSEQQRVQLRDVMGEDFVRRDADFHETARAVADAAGEGDAQRVRETAPELLRHCMGCHAQYAPLSFPGFASNPEASGER